MITTIVMEGRYEMKKFGKKINLDRDLLESPFSLVGDPERDFESLLD